ncbi:NAD(P)/FAD-dependent oxidoreductase [Dolichospermum circinale]|uniref:NAD(P)/FAD-dependent oxidoreductase n=1 Tax=Dolichospermum circinale TaxID=109265 RepID=UPI0004075552|nr:NAD(P)/FAD-dependent oxidoreductase [Dolichospermum circinale]MDB9484261.1 NAD(P)/FAD-dependent oxidoreductase [Dolichospermum circinale CS-537/05]MDB9454830.1 NAD(P)/FAD-dependent oxidoreductase [Dolichospermum circinale CS-541/06]MDB9463625.1 NAD(P)/FAD-dependent oxidoreductase [Dolichospermum circinale CS-541/04]MDB9474939.1 NAD(P)/FAD-dependent oxidoreductase [Dolichospermum circinale CS-537/11]MDB9477177.1 NAD(P)/FAD-dependent oxidoreductase [Dolichospermum circinale CS-537/03]
MTQSTTKICILGGGFGGLYTALRLSQLPWESTPKPEIILVDQSDRFVFSPLLYELLTRELQTWEIAPPYSELLEGTGIQFYQSTVSAIDINQQTVQLANQSELNYDRLVLALGGETLLDLVPGATDNAYPFRTITDAYRLEERLRILEAKNLEKIRVAIVGGGYSGVELACKLADRIGQKGRFRLIEIGDQILRTSPEFNREAAKKALDSKGVFIDLETKVVAIEKNSISLEYKSQVDTIPVDLVIWTIGTKVSPVVKSLPLKQNQRGQITTTPQLQVLEHPEIFALGDLADCLDAEGKQVPATAQVAFQQADYTAWNIWATITNRPLLPFRYQPLGEMMALGVDNATLTGLGVQLDGSFAYLARRLAYLYRLPTLNHQLKVGFNWLFSPIIQAIYR